MKRMPGSMGLLLLGLAGCSSATSSAVPDPPAKLRERYGDKTIAILKGAKRVEVFRIDSRGRLEPGTSEKDEKPGDRFGGYKVTAKGADQGEAFAKKAAAVLLDGKNFELDMAKGCKFDP